MRFWITLLCSLALTQKTFASFGRFKSSQAVRIKMGSECIAMPQLSEYLREFFLTGESKITPFAQVLQSCASLQLTEILDNLPLPDKEKFYQSIGVDVFQRRFRALNEQAARAGADFGAFSNTFPDKAMLEFYLRSWLTVRVSQSQNPEVRGLEGIFVNDLAVRFAFLVSDFEKILNRPAPLSAKKLTSHLLTASEEIESFDHVHRMMLQALNAREHDQMLKAYLARHSTALEGMRDRISIGAGTATALVVSLWLYPHLKGVITGIVGMATTVTFSLLAVAITVNAVDIAIWNQKRGHRARAQETIRACKSVFWSR